jgi:hypothetical protein
MKKLDYLTHLIILAKILITENVFPLGSKYL